MSSKSAVYGMDAFVAELGQYKEKIEWIVKPAIYEGACIAADAVKKNINSLPVYDPNKTKKPQGATAAEKAGLAEAFGIAKVKNTDGTWNTALGFDGYDDRKTTKYPNGHAYSMIARSIEAGTSWLTKYPFVKPAYNSTKTAVETKMSETVDKQIKEIQNS